MPDARYSFALALLPCLVLGCGSSDKPMPDAGVDMSVAPSCTPFMFAKPDPAQVAAGLMLVQNNKCQSCHGTSMSGNDDGVAFPGHMMAYPPNLTSDPDTGIGCWTDAQIENAILNGIDDQGQPICPPMPHFSEKGLMPADAVQIVAFLRSLTVVKNQVPDGPTCEAWGQLGGGCYDDSDCPMGASCSQSFCVTGFDMSGSVNDVDGGHHH